MTFGMAVVVGWMAFVVLFAFALLGWAVYSGQLDDVDEIRWIPLREREPEPWPSRRGRAEEE
jgi:nitrogen fixation-related uncharacterized protein